LKLNDAVFGLLLIALGGAILFAVQGFPKIPGQPVGPALFPGLIATGICVCGAVLVVRGWRERAAQHWIVAEPWVRSPRHIAAAAAVIAAILFYFFAADTLGFLIVAPLILFGLCIAMRVKPLTAVLVAVIATLVIHFAFYKMLRVPLPWGVLKGIAW
jgi:putative tricarboxylic transport membrane protein